VTLLPHRTPNLPLRFLPHHAASGRDFFFVFFLCGLSKSLGRFRVVRKEAKWHRWQFKMATSARFPRGSHKNEAAEPKIKMQSVESLEQEHGDLSAFAKK
jgi:hypothetical protein